MEIGELVTAPEFVQDDVHSESTCPWHEKPPPEQDPPVMDLQADNEDAAGGRALAPMSPNSGKKLGDNLGPQGVTSINVTYSSGETKPENLQWAPHHIIPGNAALKGSSVVPYLGAASVIKNYGGGSKIKDKQTVGYDVNCGANGVWLPSPYALSMKGNWPTNPLDKLAYVEAALDASGNLQFHFNHATYSAKVKEMLDALGDKLKLVTRSAKCPIADSSKEDKFDAPTGLLSRMNNLSGELKKFLTGDVWRPPLFTDDTLVPAYLAKKGKNAIAELRGNISPIKIGHL